MKKMTAAQLMTRKILTVDPDWPVDRLMDFLTNNSISGAPVVSADQGPIGVVSHTDIARNGAVTERSTGERLAYYRALEDVVAPEEAARFHVETQSQTTVRDIMTPMVFAVEEDATAQEIADMMITGRIHRVFVKSAGKLTGIITAMDLLPLVREM